MSEVSELLALISRDLIQKLRRPVRIAVSGAQGCGKSTACAAFAKDDPRVAHFSLDDVYAQTAERKALAAAVSPLFKVRGPPGTHDLDLATRVLHRLSAARGRDQVGLPRFDKVADHRLPEAKWAQYRGTPNVVLVDGWCMGAEPQDEAELVEPVNELERNEDASGAWRRHANQALAGPYKTFFDRFDLFVFLAAPDFAVVPRWRLEQEAALRGQTPETLDSAIRTNIERFVTHYERLTRSMLAGRVRANWTVRLDENRAVKEIDGPH